MTQSMIEAVKVAYESGMSGREIAEVIHVSYQTVYNTINKHGMKPMPRPEKPTHKNGKTVIQLAKETGWSTATIWRNLNANKST